MNAAVARLPSIRVRLLQLVAACVVPAAVMAGALVVYDYVSERDRLYAGTMGTVRAIASALDAELAQPRQALSTLAATRLLKAGRLDAFHVQMREVRPRLNLTDLFLIGDDDRMLLHTAAAVTAPLPPPPQDMVESLSDTRPAITGLSTDPVTRQRAVFVLVPLPEIGSGRALGASVDPRRVEALLARQQLPAHWIAAVFDQTGTVIARSREMDRFLGKKAAPAVLERLPTQSEAIFDAVSLEGIEVVTLYSKARETGWTVAVGIPRDSLVGEVGRKAGWLAAAALGLLAFSLLLAWRLGERLVASMQALRTPALALGHGQPVTAPPVSFREAAQVGDALVDAGQRLEQAGSALQQSEARLRGMIDSAMDAIVAVDEREQIQLFNPAACRMFGWSQAEAIGQPLERLLPAHARTGTDVTAATGIRRDGESFPVEATVSHIALSGDALQTLILRDVSARQKAHDALLRSNLDLQQFAFVASHDLRGPLSTLSSYLDMLRQRYSDGMPDKGREIIERSGQAVRHLDALTEALLGYARIDSQPKPFAQVDMGQLVRDVIDALAAPIREAGAQLTVDELPTVWGDRTQLAQLMQNLLGNALKYRGTAAPVVHIGARRQPPGWAFSVADNGIGIEPRHQKRIFEIFKRLHTQREYPGTGIGLAVCKRVVDRHGGTLWVESVAGQGSTFWFTVTEEHNA